MERRVLLAIFLSFLVLWGYQAMLPKPVPKPAAQGASGTVAASGRDPGALRPRLFLQRPRQPLEGI